MQALAQNREDLAREALSRRAGISTQLEGLKTQHDQLVEQEEPLVATTQALQPRRSLPDPEGDTEGVVHRSAGADPDRRSRLRHLGVR